MRRYVGSLVIGAICLLPGIGRGQVREVTLEEAVRRGLEHSPELRMGRQDILKAGDDRLSAGLAIGPRLSLDAGIQWWDQATRVQFIDAGQVQLTPEQIETLRTFLGDGFVGMLASLNEPMEIQKRVTGTVTLQAVQPITPLWSLAEIYRLQGANAEAAELEQQARRLQVTYRVTETFFRLRQALRMVEVTDKAVEQVEAHLKTARAFQEAGLVGRDDVLRAETMLFQVQDKRSQALAGVALARTALAIQMGLPPTEMLVPVGDFPELPTDSIVEDQEAIDQALSHRPEVGSVEARNRMARAGWNASVGALIPTIAGVFRYQHFEGSKFQRADSWFVGAQLTWNFWNLGQDFLRMKAAGRDVEKAREGLQGIRDQVVLDVRKALLDLRTARSSVEANRKAIESAEENLRVVTKKYEVSTATSVEVLDAQSALTQARANLEVALGNCFIAYANLQRALGGQVAAF
ncbi:MAG TPA: TolC family protein [Myxococcota bacterium]|nr:TolC family protein [Myxococcota bacterium]HQK49707.1 TolC family protein [Myxococcota bacterium]